MSTLIRHSNGVLIPADVEHAASVMVIPGSIAKFQGPGVLVITPDALAICTKTGIVAAISLLAVTDVNVKRFDGIVMEYETSVGPVVAPPPGGGYGLEISYSLDIHLQGRWKIMTFYANQAHDWESAIRDGAFTAQTSRIPRLKGPSKTDEWEGE